MTLNNLRCLLATQNFVPPTFARSFAILWPSEGSKRAAGEVTKLGPYQIPSETTREGISSSSRWALGLIEGDGHIGLEWTNKYKHKWTPVLKVTLHLYNSRAIYKLKKILTVGKISRHNNTITLRVRSRALWEKHLIPYFERYTFITSKFFDFVNVKNALSFHNNYLPLQGFLRKQRQETLVQKLVLTNKFFLQTKQNSVLKPKQALVYYNQRCYTYDGFYKFKIGIFKNRSEYQTKSSNKLSPVWNTVMSTYQLNIPFTPVQIQQYLQKLHKVPKNQLIQILKSNWLAGFIEAEGSFYILENGAHGFGLGQTNDVIIVLAMHRLFDIQAKLKVRHNYVLLDTKNTQNLFAIATYINKKLLGMKSFMFSIWLRTLRKKVKAKSLKAKQIINKIRSRTYFAPNGPLLSRGTKAIGSYDF